jgi:ribosomal protein L31E
LLRELPDRDERAQNQAWIHYELERIATLFFGANQKGVSGLLLVLRLIYRVRLFIHDTNFTRQVLAAMTMIIKFLPRHIAARDRVAIASEGARVIVNGAIEQIKSRDAKAMLGFVIDSIVVLSRASRHVDDAKIPN